MTLRLIGRIQSRHLDDAKALLADQSAHVGLDLEEVTVVDLEVVRFLISCEACGIKVLNCPCCIQEWMGRERSYEK